VTRPHRVDPRQPARNRGGNRDEYVRGYKAGLGASPPTGPPTGESQFNASGCFALIVGAVVFILVAVVAVKCGRPS
jgi:hypothetical protein